MMDVVSVLLHASLRSLRCVCQQSGFHINCLLRTSNPLHIRSFPRAETDWNEDHIPLFVVNTEGLFFLIIQN